MSEAELRNPPETLTDREKEALHRRRKQTVTELDQLNGFLHSMGHR
ncbi:hypothetical protein SLNWT_4570 [Streptomyces albus]|uniref:Bacterial toxin 28 domain-containing protein n=2 Tax=Streptomyces TaxID=1883 RepID=A0A0B5F249_STRA4|nr:hypothetical protein SLNWT_4570 [Streptomyces albus]AOU79250.1 hypothetical protein SLNHY_4559 [Streptomyces albus]AYN34981.1 hypothetical protein DUI70_4483 [Streptomyces albus]